MLLAYDQPMNVFRNLPVDLDTFQGDLVICIIGEDEKPLLAANSWVDWRLYGSLNQLLIKGYFQGKRGERCLLPTYGKFPFDRLVLLGSGPLFEVETTPTSEEGRKLWNEMAQSIHGIKTEMKVSQIGLSLPRFREAEEEKTMIQILERNLSESDSSLFVSRALAV